MSARLQAQYTFAIFQVLEQDYWREETIRRIHEINDQYRAQKVVIINPEDLVDIKQEAERNEDSYYYESSLC